MSTGTEAVRLLNLITLPSDDTYFGLFQGGSAELVKRTFEHAAIDYERIVDAIQVVTGD